MRRSTLFLAACLLSAQTPKPAEDAAANPFGSLRGAVREEVTGTFLSGVVIAVGGYGGLTHDDGSFSIVNIPPGKYLVTASHRSMQPVSRTVTIESGKELTLDFLVTARPTISGRVVHADDKPAAGVTLWLIQFEYSYGSLLRQSLKVQSTDENGSFTLDAGLEPDRSYYLLASPAAQDSKEHKPIEAPTYYGGATSLDAATGLLLRPAEHREQLEIRLRQQDSYCADGGILIEGQPGWLPLKIQETALAGSQIIRTLPSLDEDGTFRACGLTPGQYRLATLSSSSPWAEREFVVADSDVHDLRLVAERVPLHLQLLWDGDPPPDVPTAPDAGRFVRHGDSWSLMSDDGKTLVTTVGLPGFGKLLDSLQPDTAAYSRTMSGVLENVRRALRPRDLTIELVGLTEEALFSRTFRVPFEGPYTGTLPTGDFTVYAYVTGSYIKEMTFNGLPVTDRRLHPAAGGTLRIVASPGGGSITCNVRDASGDPVSDSEVLAVPENVASASELSARMLSGTTYTSGEASFLDLIPGKYRVLALSHTLVQTPERMERLLAALATASLVEVTAKASTSVKLEPVTIQ